MTEEQEEELDPRIQIELEKLNTCTDSINTLETELDDLNGIFRARLADGIQKLSQLHGKLGRCISKAEPYYLAREISRKAQLEAQRAAVQYQRSVTAHQAAKETIQLAEERFLSNHDEWEFDAAWQEMLNHATMKVMEAETNKTKSEQEHQQKAASFAVAKEKLLGLEKQLKSSISKSRTYFDLKQIFHEELESLKAHIYKVHTSITSAKAEYSESLHNLEVISEQIHMRRQLQRPREPGVGAENEFDLPDILLDNLDKNLKDLHLKDDAEGDSEHLGDEENEACCRDAVESLPFDMGEHSLGSGAVNGNDTDENSLESAAAGEHSLESAAAKENNTGEHYLASAALKAKVRDLPLVLSVAGLRELEES